ncbi:aminopeptidase P family protein [Flavobacteriaceae bacterium]|nr:aminopeptidase P family protein [Flavobacteriaceae bacterium]MDA9886200.1 aminopeptidase P family protein [Flavobacteriaceae bacterium]MDB4112925.1 aminopeptidase P family protein [Flavobacteriaceae bacterium]MDB4186743.1 aminopeptidase P family protein [Flavobacteriaceae bacterium]MDB9886626.1 aminopeptidase P family protein [Flavobacteriaceae bacterium]
MRTLLFLFTTLFSLSITAQAILPLKERAIVMEEIQHDRFTKLLPALMKEHHIDAWVLITREYNEDPVVKTMLPPTWLNARRRTILVFTLDPKTGVVSRAAITRYPFGKLIPSVWKKEEQPNQMKALVDYLRQKNPKKIGINTSENYGIVDGLAQTDYRLFEEALSSTLKKRLVSAEPLATAWIETRTAREMMVYNQLVEITHNIIAEAFSTKVITPGVTTTDDVVWWLREKVSALGLKTWFHPTIDVQRTGNSDLYAFDGKSKFDVIQPGDLVHCDFGITYLGLNTDCQELAYVLRREETKAPKELEDALADGNRVQDLFTDRFKTGRTGNETLAMALEAGRAEGLRPQIYTHPLGLYGHSAGTTFGMWDSQEGVPGSGDWPLHENTVYAIELNTKVYIEAWEKDIRIMLEEAGYFGPNGFAYVNKRQTKLYLIGE